METKQNYTFEESSFTSLTELFKENNEDLEYEKNYEGNEFDENASPAMFNQVILKYASKNLEAENTDIISLFGVSLDDSEELSALVDYMDDNEDSVLSDGLNKDAIGMWKYNIKDVDIIIGGDYNANSHLFLAKKDLGAFNDYVKTINFDDIY